MPNVPELVSPSVTELTVVVEEAVTAAAIAKEEAENAETARATSEAEANSAAESAQSAEEGGYPAGKEAAETITVLATEPEAGAEKSVEFGEPGIVHSVKAVFVGDAAKTAWKVKHELGTLVTSTTFHSENEEEEPGIQTLVKESKTISANEIEVVLNTAPAAKETFWLIVTG